MRILITGGTGLLGKGLIESAKSEYEIMATYTGNYEMPDSAQAKYKKIDIRNKVRYTTLFRDFKPEAVIHTASISSPDYAEKHKEETWEVNVLGTANILHCSEKFNSIFIYISSNGIYEGNNAPYDEEDFAKPINYYGSVKLAGEQIIRKSAIPHAIVRPILMYGWNYSFERMNIVTLSLEKLKKQENVYLYKDVFCNPLFSNSCAKALWRIIDKKAYDIFNIAGKDIVSIYQMIKTAADIFSLDQRFIKPVEQGFFNELALRPKNTSYKTSKMERVLGIAPLALREGLTKMKEQLKG